MKKLSSLSIVLTIITALCGSASAQQVPSQETLDELVKVYCAAWSEPDVPRRRELLEKVWASTGTYTDPQFHVEGLESLVELIGAFLKKFPRAQIIPSSHADFHHRMLRFTWKFVDGDGKAVIEGIDFGALNRDGKFEKIVGFFGPIKPL